jgi:hypothetical protein
MVENDVVVGRRPTAAITTTMSRLPFRRRHHHRARGEVENVSEGR